MSRSAWSPLPLSALLLLQASGCGELRLTYGAETDGGEVRVLTWWSEGGASFDYESDLGLALAETDFTLRRLTLAELQDHAGLRRGIEEASRSAHKEAVAQLLEEERWRELPDAFLTNGGYDVRRWTPCGGTEPSRLVPLDDYLDPAWLANTFPRTLLETVSCEGHVYALPLGMNRTNLLAYNRQRLREERIDRPEDQLTAFSDLERLAESLEGSRFGRTREPTLLAVPVGDAEATSRLLVDNFMRSWAGDEFEELWQTGTHETKLEQALSKLSSWQRLLTPSSGTPAELLESVRSGDAFLAPITDGIAGILRQEDSLRIGAMSFPGTTDQWVFQLDVFAVPAKPDPTRGIVWVQAVAEREVQARYSQARPAWPVRSDLLSLAAYPSGPSTSDTEYAPPYAELLLTDRSNSPERRFAELTLRRLARDSGDVRSAYPDHAALVPPADGLGDVDRTLSEWIQRELCVKHAESDHAEKEHARPPDPSPSQHSRGVGCDE